MPYVNISKPNQGDVTLKSWADAVVDNLTFFNSIISGLTAMVVPNGSFELDSDADGEPDEWESTLYTGGSMAITGDGLADTDCNHGRRAIKFTSPGGSGNGGGYVQTADFIDVSPMRLFVLSWQLKSTAAAVRNKVNVMFYDAAQTLISTTTIFSSVDNPTDWLVMRGAALPPSTARYAKVQLVGAENTTTVAGSVYWDDVQIHQPEFRNKVLATGPGPFTFVPPAGVWGILVEVFGGGGAGFGGTNGSGGGGGAYARKFIEVTPGVGYAGEVGAGGAGSSTLGADGDQSSFNGTVIAAGGAAASSTNGGAGGSAGGGDENLDGEDGEDRVVGDHSGYGGACPANGIRSPGHDPLIPGGAGRNGVAPGAGGGGDAGGGGGGSGGDGQIIIWF